MSDIKLPKDWKAVRLNEICDKVSLNKIKIKQKQYLSEGKYPVIDQGQGLIGGYFNDEKLIVPKEPPYIIFGDHTKIKKFINFKFIPGADGVKVLKPKKNIDPKFLFYSLFTIKIEDKGYARHFQLLEKELFPLPPPETQQAIVSKIEELFSDLDKGIEDLKNAQQQLKTYRQSVLKWAFEGKLTNVNVKDGVLPKGWKTEELGNLSEMRLGKMLDKNKNKGNFHYYLRNISVRWGAFDLDNLSQMRFEESEEEKYELLENDLVICEGGEPGRCAIWKKEFPKMKIQKALHRVRVKNNLFVKFLYHFMFYSGNTGLLEKYFTGTTIKHLTGNGLKKVCIPLPLVNEQHQIVQEIESRLSVADKMEESINQSLQQAEALRQSILKKAFSGELV
ncbi:restriction endonuclease subunit S [Yeosuana sp.]|uniref:restriction endonuclease subunit S n=1 Tax=Yeosuana sp. TaxID=2529388 RepID=UPI004054F34B